MKKRKAILIGLGLAALYWILESAAMVLIFNEGSFVEQVFTPDSHELWMRSTGMGIIFALSLYTQLVVGRRNLVEQALQDSRGKYQVIFDEARDGIVLIDSQTGHIVDCNPEYERQTGRKLEQLREMKVWELRPPELMEEAKKLFFELRNGNLGGSREFEFQRPDGTIIPVEFEARVINIRGKQHLCSIVRDITERRQTEQELRISHEQLRALSTRLQSAREEERRKIAREIHDELGQSLTVLKMDLSWLGKRLPEEQTPLLEKTKTMIKLVDNTMKTVRRISTELRPGLLDDLGLIAAIEWHAEEFSNLNGLRCQVTSNCDGTILGQDLSTAIFRIFQETLLNVARHSSATKVRVSLTEENSSLMMEVSDNGKGITRKEISSPKSLGLVGMRERALLFGGEINIIGNPGKGTTVTVNIPLNEEGAA